MLSKLKSEKKHSHFFIYFVLLTVFVFTAVSLVTMQVEISQKTAEYDNLTKALADVESSNEQLERYASDEYRSEYIEQIARDSLDYSYSDETVYYFIPE